ncbi:GTPase [Schaalia vaccimaxillae]|uniref:GTPase n=1 Tax=Schaalia vaccimaxillae TaxID=183916 RepID=UPI00041ABD07|nr:GTPase [Schaalia vaccimaxillae]
MKILRSKSAAPTIEERADALDRVLELAGQDLDPHTLTDVRLVMDTAVQRRGLDPATTVVGLLGATGSGKSSLVNVLVGSEVARTGVTRPTTTQALALVSPDTQAGDLLDWMQIAHRHELDADSPWPSGVVLVDLPDIDSVSVSHRQLSGRLAQRLDLVIWVVDPQKYADGVIHEEWIIPLHSRQAEAVVVLTHIDELTPSDRNAVEKDLRRLVEADGVKGARFVSTSIITGEGVDQLRGIIADVAVRIRQQSLKIHADLTDIANRIGDDLGITGPVDWVDTDGLAQALVSQAGDAVGVPRVIDAVGASYRHRAGQHTGWLALRWLRSLRADPLAVLGLRPRDRSGDVSSLHVPDLPAASMTSGPALMRSLRNVSTAVTQDRPETWQRRMKAVILEQADELAHELDTAVAGADLGPVTNPRWWSASNALQWIGWLVALAGVIWLGAVHLMRQYFLIPWDPPRWHDIPIPVWLLVGGVVATVFIACVSWLLTLLGAAGRRRRARASIDKSITEAVEATIVAAIVAEDERQGAIADSLALARAK